MRIRLGMLIVGLILLFALLTNYYIIGNLEADSRQTFQQELRTSFLAYQKAHEANASRRLEVAAAFAAEPELIATMLLPHDTAELAENRHFRVYERLEVISRLRYPAELVIVTDTDGIELARTLVATWTKNDYSGKRLTKEALAGKPGEDFWRIGQRVMLVNVVPIYDQSRVLGLLIVANSVGESLIAEERHLGVISRGPVAIDETAGSAIFVEAPGVASQHAGPKYAVGFSDLAFFSAERVIKSSLDTHRQDQLNSFLISNSQHVAEWLASKNKLYERSVTLGGETYHLVAAPYPTLQDDSLVGVMLLRSEGKWLKAFSGSRNFLMILSVLLAILGVSLAALIVQKAYDAIDFILEGAHQIIVGNKDYQFASANEYLNQLGQTLNLMIAILLGKYIPEDEDEAVRLSMRGTLDGGTRGAIAPKDRMLIEAIDEQVVAQTPPVAATGDVDEDAYFDRIFDEFIKAKKQVGDDISQVTKQRMAAKLKRAEEKLIEKHGCASVRFDVKIEQNKVTLKPTPIWK